MNVAATIAQAPAARPSISEGPAVRLPANHPRTLAEALRRTAAAHPENGIGYLDAAGTAVPQAYARLLPEASSIAAGLVELGLQAGQPVIFQLADNADFIPAFWGCQLAGLVPVPVGIAPTYEHEHASLTKLRNAWTLLDRPLVLTSRALADRLAGFGRRQSLPGLRIAEIETLRTRPPTGALPDAAPDDVALMLLTSGSTGVPKMVQQTHRSLLAWATSVADACGFTPADVSLNWMPLDHVGGLVMFHLRDLVLGCGQLHAPTEAVLQEPLRVEAGHVTPPDVPGTGIRWNEDGIKRCLVP